MAPSLAERSTEPEQLDLDPPREEVRRSLADLRFVNRWLGGRRALLGAVRPHLRAGARLLDVGCGSGDLPLHLLERLPGPILAVGVDIKTLHLLETPPPLRRVAADLRRLPFPDAAFDVVTASLVLHHFDSADLAPVLRELYRLSRRALVVNDLHRSLVPLLFGHAAFPVLFRSPLSVHDGLVSVRRGFRPRELQAAFVAAGVPGVRIRRRFPYRLLAVAERLAA